MKKYKIEFLGLRKDGRWLNPVDYGEIISKFGGSFFGFKEADGWKSSSNVPEKLLEYYLPGVTRAKFNDFDQACEYMMKNLKGANPDGISAVFCVEDKSE